MTHARKAGDGWRTTPEQAQNPYGSASDPTYLEQRYLSRLYGQDQAYNYALKRGGDDIDARMAAGGSYNSGARGQQLSDFGANMAAQSQGQLDALAGGATGARQNSLNAMFGQGQALAGGQAGLASAYDIGAAGNIAGANNAMNQMALNSAGQQQQQRQGAVNNLMNMYSLYKMNGSGGGGGG